jgi:hypothetical protein
MMKSLIVFWLVGAWPGAGMFTFFVVSRYSVIQSPLLILIG